MPSGAFDGGRVLRLRLAVHPEQPGLELVVEGQGDGRAADEGVALLLGVLPDHRGELVGQGRGIDREAVVVVRAEVDDEHVGHHGAPAAHHGSALVHLALQRCGDLDRLDLGLERASEGTVDHPVEPLLESVEQTHRASQRRRPAPHPRRCAPCR